MPKNGRPRMTSNPLYGRFDDMAGALLSPKTKATHNSVADLFGGIGGVHLAAHNVGLEVVYAYEPDTASRDIYAANTGLTPDNTPLESYTFDHVPPFQLLIAGLPEGGTWADAFGFVLRCLRVRRPVAAVLQGPPETDPDHWAQFLEHVREQTGRLGYQTDSITLDSRDFGMPPGHRRAVVMGMLRPVPLVWPVAVAPLVLTASYELTSRETLNLRGYPDQWVLPEDEDLAWELAVEAPPIPMLQAIVETVARAVAAPA